MPRDDDTVGRSELEVIRSEAARAADAPLLDRVAAMVDFFKRERQENHWVNRSREAFRHERDAG